jgi:hypothetical protein
MLEIVNAETKTYTHAAQIVDAEKTTAQTKIIKLIRVWSEPKERYADLHSQVRTSSAHEFVFSIYHDIADHERKTGKRVRKRHWRTGKKLVDTLERFVGDLLRVKAGTTVPALVYRAVGSSSFKHDPVKYDMFMRALEALKALDLVGHRKGQSRYAKTPFGNAQLPGHAARFWATAKLLRLAEDYGIHSGNVGEHFAPEPPRNPLVLKDYASGKGKNHESGPRIKYKDTDFDTAEAKRLEGDVRELNDFLARVELLGGEHYGYMRVFNNLSWKKGGRLYSIGENCYQRLPEAERLKMTINGEPVAEIDIKASFLTIYHALLKQPLQGTGDPYAAIAGIDRSIVKQWTTISFGNSKPATRWPPKMAKDFKKETGKLLGKVAEG